MKQDKLTELGRIIVSSGNRSALRTRFIKAGYEDIPYRGIAKGLIASLVVTVLWYIYIVIATSIISYGIFFFLASMLLLLTIFEIVLVFAAWILMLMYLDVKAFSRTQDIELNLPLFLREFATNLKAGREFVDAMEDSLSPHLGQLNDDMQKLVIDIRSGIMTETVLKNYSKRYDSYAINETFEIILEAYKGGGGLAEIIDRIAENLEVIHYLKKNAIASVSNYIIFTTIVSLLIAPLLFALSFNLLQLISTLMNKIVVQGNVPGFLGAIQGMNINWDDFKNFSRLGVVIISGSAAAIIGIIRKGSLRGAAFIIPMYAAISFVMYEIFRWALGILFELLYSV